MDDILIKIKPAEQHVDDLEDTFSTLRSYRLKLNPIKCTFRVKTRRLLGYMIT